MMKILKNKSGLMLLDLMFALAILGVIVLIGLSFFRNAILSTELDGEIESFLANMELARSNAISGLDDSAHGIHLAADSYTMFVGSSYDSNDSNNFVVELADNISIDSISLNGSGSDIIFQKGDGETSQYGSFKFSSSASSESITITVSSLGTVSY